MYLETKCHKKVVKLRILICICIDLYPGDSAREAVAAGVDGIIVSNHGGRQLDGVLASVC